MRALTLLVLVPFLPGCGHARAAAPEAPRPTPVVVMSDAGEQHAVPGSYCARSGGQGVCGDTAYPAPTQASVVRPGEKLRIGVPGATSIDLELHRLGCHQDVLRHIRVNGELWRVDVAPGVYEALVVARLREGDTSAGIGLWVSRTRPLEIVRTDTIRTLCP
jgi:hypothetical protein